MPTGFNIAELLLPILQLDDVATRAKLMLVVVNTSTLCAARAVFAASIAVDWTVRLLQFGTPLSPAIVVQTGDKRLLSS